MSCPMPWESRVVPAKSGELSTKQQETTILIMFDCLINFDPLSIYATFVERFGQLRVKTLHLWLQNLPRTRSSVRLERSSQAVVQSEPQGNSLARTGTFQHHSQSFESPPWDFMDLSGTFGLFLHISLAPSCASAASAFSLEARVVCVLYVRRYTVQDTHTAYDCRGVWGTRARQWVKASQVAGLKVRRKPSTLFRH